MIENYKISVIVPIYKVEKYIERCATSLFEQTIDNIEYIFIDDCTPDKSMEILRLVIEKYRIRLAEEKKVVRVMRMPTNSGLPAVRRHGIIHAKGDYIIHCDSDDWVDTNLYELLYNRAIETGAEVVICPVIEEWGERTASIHMYEDLGDSCQMVLKNWYKNCVQMYTVNKLVRASVYKDNHILPYEGISMWEDNGLMFRVFYYASGLAHINNSSYHYRKENENAITYNYGRGAIDQMIKCASLLYDFFSTKIDFKEYEKTALSIKFLSRINLITTSFKDLKEYYRLYPESSVIISSIGENAFSKNGIIRFRFVKYHFAWLFVLIFKMYSWINK